MKLNAIIPLAGPDFELSDGSTKAQLDIGGTPLLRRAIESRSWWRRGELDAAALCFVLRDSPISRAFASDVLRAWYPGAATIFLGRETGGAALSAIAGVSLTDADGPLCVDLADILYTDTFSPLRHFRTDRHGGAALTFASDKPCYSYLRLGPDGNVVEAAEKRVISGHASAGTYFFRDRAVFVAAVAHAMRHADTQAHAGRLFVCPLFNGVLAEGLEVAALPVTDVHDVKEVPR